MHVNSDIVTPLANSNSREAKEIEQRVMEIMHKRIQAGRSSFNGHLQNPVLQQVPAMPNALRYINPIVASHRLGYVPPAISGEIPRKPTWEEQYKTIMCEAWLTNGECPYGGVCRFAHGEHELRPVNYRPQPINRRKYKTKLCEKYTKNGICPYGNNCFFVHPDPNGMENQRFFESYRRPSGFEQLAPNDGFSADYRNGFSASVPTNSSFLDEHLQREFSRLNAMNQDLMKGSISNSSSSFTSYRDPNPPMLTPSSSTSGKSPLPSLKDQVLENLRIKNDPEFVPPNSDYDPFKSFDFAHSFAGFKF